MAFQTLPDEDAVAIGTCGNLCVLILTGQPTVPGLERIFAVTGGIIAEHGDVATLTIVRAGLPFPEGDYRKRSAEIMREREGTSAGNVLALEGDGFWQAAARTVLSGIELLARSKSRLDVVASLEEGLDAMQAGLKTPLPLDAVKAEVRSWRNTFPDAVPRTRRA